MKQVITVIAIILALGGQLIPGGYRESETVLTQEKRIGS
jgi:hypothetical protein